MLGVLPTPFRVALDMFGLGVAALNSPTASSAGCKARGEESADSGFRTRVKLASVKQEISTNSGLARVGLV